MTGERIRTYTCVCDYCACDLHTEQEITQRLSCPLGFETHWTEGFTNDHE